MFNNEGFMKWTDKQIEFWHIGFQQGLDGVRSKTYLQNVNRYYRIGYLEGRLEQERIRQA